MAGNARYEVRYENQVVGPVTWDQIRRGQAVEKIPPGARARRVGAWQPVDQLLASSGRLHATTGLPAHVPLEVRADGQVVGPVTLDQLRRGRALARIPDGAEVRPVGPWRRIGELTGARRAPVSERAALPLRRPTAAPPPATRAPAAQPARKKQRWRLMLAKDEPAIVVDTTQLSDGLLKGAVRLSAEVCAVGADEWVPVWDVPELANAIQRLPPASLQPGAPVPRAQEWFLELPDSTAGPERLVTDQLLERIRQGSVPLAARVRATNEGRWLPVWDVPEFAAAIQEKPPETWHALQAAQSLFRTAEAARDPTVAIQLYASCARQLPDSPDAEQTRRDACARITNRARALCSTLLAQDQPRQAAEFLATVRDTMHEAGLEQSHGELEWRVSLELAERSRAKP